MQKYADYIKEIEIDSLWAGQKHIRWELDKHVNILSGINGVGKSTILNKVIKGLSQGGEFPSHMLKGVHIKGFARRCKLDQVRYYTFVRPPASECGEYKQGGLETCDRT